MSQQTIDFFTYNEIVEPSRSEPGTNHVIGKEFGKYFCSCKGFQYHGDCYHIRGEKIKELSARLRFQIEKDVPISRSHFKSLKQIIDWVEFKSSPEHELFCNTALQYARSSGQVSADDVHAILGEELCWGRRGIGSALKSLQTREYLEALFTFKSKRKVTHGRPIVQYGITQRGRELVG